MDRKQAVTNAYRVLEARSGDGTAGAYLEAMKVLREAANIPLITGIPTMTDAMRWRRPFSPPGGSATTTGHSRQVRRSPKSPQALAVPVFPPLDHKCSGQRPRRVPHCFRVLYGPIGGRCALPRHHRNPSSAPRRKQRRRCHEGNVLQVAAKPRGGVQVPQRVFAILSWRWTGRRRCTRLRWAQEWVRSTAHCSCWCVGSGAGRPAGRTR